MANQRNINEEINKLPPDPFADRIDPAGQNRKTYEYTTLKEGAAAFFKKNILKDAKVFQAIVIDVELDSPLLRQRSARAQTDSSAQEYVAVRARIPKLHAHILSPKMIPMDKSKPGAKGIIQQHPLFIAKVGPKTPIPAEGSIIKVSFGKGPVSGQYDGIYLELYEGPAAFDDQGRAVDPATKLQFSIEPGERIDIRERSGDGITTMTPLERQQAELHSRRVGEPPPVGNPPDPATQVGPPPNNGLTPFASTIFNSPYPVSSEYGLERGTRNHNGIDFATPLGTPLKAVCGGTIRAVRLTDQQISDGLAAPRGSNENKNARAGRFVEIRRSDGVTARYLHMNKIESNLQTGDTVEAGAKIGETGDTGSPGSFHLHFEAMEGGDARNKVNPRRYLTNDTFNRGDRSLPPTGQQDAEG